MQVKKQQLEQRTGSKLGKEYIKAVYCHPAYLSYMQSTSHEITVDSDCSHEIKRHLLLGRKAMTNLDSILKSRDITLLTNLRMIKAMVFAVVMYGCES